MLLPATCVDVEDDPGGAAGPGGEGAEAELDLAAAEGGPHLVEGEQGVGVDAVDGGPWAHAYRFEQLSRSPGGAGTWAIGSAVT
jgi:hypothetical protein